MTENPSQAVGCVSTCGIFLLIAAPVYLLMRFLVSLVRAEYGFDQGDAAPDSGPPLRICGSCHNTVLEPDYAHCPYCGAPLPDAPTDTSTDAPE